MLYDIIIETILGGATGYITSKYVIDMMLHKYSLSDKLSYGNTIVGSKAKFADNVSTLMERDIINAQKISDEFLTHDFEKELEGFSKDFINECICRDIRSLRLKDVPVYYDICGCFKAMLESIVANNISTLIEKLSDKIKLTDLFTKEQISHISENLIQNLILTVKNTKLVGSSLSQLYDSFSDSMINELVPKGAAEQIKINLDKQSAYFGDILKENMDERIDDICSSLLDACNINDIIDKLQDSVSDRPIRDLINLNTVDIRNRIVDSIVDFLSTEKADRAITNIYYELVNFLVSQNTSMASMFGREYIAAITELLKGTANSMAYSVIQWMDNNGSEMNQMIKDTIDEVVIGHSDLKQKIFTAISDFYKSSKYGSNASMIKILLEFAYEGENLEKIIAFIISDIDNYIKGTNIRDAIKLLEEKKYISPSILKSKILGFIQSENKAELDKIVEYLISKPVGEFIDIDLNKIYNGKFKYVLIDYIKDKIFYSKKTYLNLTKDISKYLSETLEGKLGEILDREDAQDDIYNINKLIISDINNNYDKIKLYIENSIIKLVEEKKIDALLDKLSEKNNIFDIRTSDRLTKLINKNFSKIIDEIGNTRISKLLTGLDNVLYIHKTLSDFMKDIVAQSIASITDGYINELVNEHFEGMTDEEFVEFIKDITGTDEGKLSRNGAYIGAAVGFSASLASTLAFEQTIISNAFSWRGAVLCSSIGITASLAAINGFSKKHSSNGLLKKIPLLKNCTEEFVTENQNAFAAYMGNVVEENLINEEIIRDLMQSKSSRIKQCIYGTIASNDYQRIYQCIDNNKQYISLNLLDMIKNAIIQHKDSISDYLVKGIANVPIKQLLNRNIIDSITENTASKNDVIYNKIYDYIKQKTDSGISLFSCMSQPVFDRLKEDIALSIDESYTGYIDFIKNTDDLKKGLKKYNKSFESIMDKPAITVLHPESLDIMESSIFNNIYKKIFSREKVNSISKHIFSILTEGEDKKLRDIITGKNKVLLNGMFFKYYKDIVLSFQNLLIAGRHQKIEGKIREKLFNSMNLRDKSSYNMIGADKAISDIVDKLFLNKLPEFFDKNFEQFYEISKSITHDLYDYNLEDIKLKLDYDKIEEGVYRLFDWENKASIVNNKSYLLFRLYMQGFDNKKTGEIARYFNLDSISSICKAYSSEITSFSRQLYANAKKNKPLLSNRIYEVFKYGSEYILKSLEIKALLSNISSKDKEALKSNIKYVFDDGDLIALTVNNLVNCFYNYLEDIDLLDSIVNIADLKTALKDVINNFISDDELKRLIETMSDNIITQDLSKGLRTHLPKSASKYLIEMLTDGFYLSIRKNLNELFKCIELDRITRDEIKKLTKERYQELFSCMYKGHIREAVIFGTAGGVLGINKYAGLLLSAVDILRLKLKNKFKK